MLAGHADALAALALVADVNLAGRIFANEDRGQTRSNSRFRFESGDAVSQLSLKLRGERFAVEDFGGHGFTFAWPKACRIS